MKTTKKKCTPAGGRQRSKKERKQEERKGRKRMIQKIPLGSTSITEAGVPFLYVNGENDETYIGDDDGSTIIHFGKLSVAGTSLLTSLLATGHIREDRLMSYSIIRVEIGKEEKRKEKEYEERKEKEYEEL